ncbi:MAG: LolA-like outer membrane lipoprotein chaperone [Campylobacterota bacterium]|nr:LolA-like outer membrane lipoprotein chaperone [Campylobacterota bacterium]
MFKILFTFYLSMLFVFANDLKEIDTFQANFSQSIINNSGDEIIYTGKFYIKKPAMILWEYQTPIEKKVYVTNSNVAIIEPDLEQAIVSKLEKELNIINMIKDSKKVSENLYESNMYNTTYKFIIKNNIIQSIKYKDQIDNKVTIDFSNIIQNKEINNSVFKYNIPFEYDIIRK